MQQRKPMEPTISPLPLYQPSAPIKFNVGMEKNAPFIVTNHLQRSDLGYCIISTTAPHFVAKIRAFKTNPEYKPDKVEHNKKQDDLTGKQEYLRLKYFHTRDMAEQMAAKAEEKEISIKEFIENILPNLPINESGDFPHTYDEEFDEPRIIAKVPGLNVYLELFGCLDDIPSDQIPWEGYNGAYSVLTRMSLWAQNAWTREERKSRASRISDEQLLPDWREDYDETLRPYMQHKKGIGVWPHIDASRRPELLYSKAPKFSGADIELIRGMKADRAERNAKGIKD